MRRPPTQESDSSNAPVRRCSSCTPDPVSCASRIYLNALTHANVRADGTARESRTRTGRQLLRFSSDVRSRRYHHTRSTSRCRATGRPLCLAYRKRARFTIFRLVLRTALTHAPCSHARRGERAGKVRSYSSRRCSPPGWTPSRTPELIPARVSTLPDGWQIHFRSAPTCNTSSFFFRSTEVTATEGPTTADIVTTDASWRAK